MTIRNVEIEDATREIRHLPIEHTLPPSGTVKESTRTTTCKECAHLFTYRESDLKLGVCLRYANCPKCEHPVFIEAVDLFAGSEPFPVDPADFFEDGPCPSCEYEEGRSEADKRYHEENCG